MDSDGLSKLDHDLERALIDRDYDHAARLLDREAHIDRQLRRTEVYDRDLVEETSTYLIDAAMAGDLGLMGFLLQHGANPNIAGTFSGRTALLAAAGGGHAAAVDLLLAQATEVDAIDRYNARTAIGYAVENVDPAIVRSLLAVGARGSFSRLGFSVKGGAEAREVVGLLMEHGCNINELDDWGRTPLMWAGQYAEVETVRCMIELGADVNRVSEANMNGVCSHETALGLARRNKREDVVALLQQHGARNIALSLPVRIWRLLTR